MLLSSTVGKIVSDALCITKIIVDDLPFYLPQNRSSQETNESKDRSGNKTNHSSANQRPSGIDPGYMYPSESWSDDYRSIIDDLTVENKDLKQRLKKYEQMHSSHLQENKLFEVYIHHLPSSKRRRLERMLRNFASEIGPTDAAQYAQAPNQRLLGQPVPATIKRSHSSQSTSKPLDSGYASNSVSAGGASSYARSHRELVRPTQPMQNANQRVRSYVQDLPAGLLPKGAPFMSEEAKKKSVVRKLEQLFLGRGDVSSRQGQSYQQQEVSRQAARADRRETEAAGRKVANEGFREAKISKGSNAKKNKPALLSSVSTSSSSASVSGKSSNGSIDQRPTRPLDLDPSRAHDPKETIQYMKHLGFDSPALDQDQPSKEEKGWVYLNLLMNMAQLHVINVTPAFVRSAVSEYSKNFELSEDGRSIRWNGGLEPTQMSDDGLDNEESNNFAELSGPVQDSAQSKRARPGLSTRLSRSSVQNWGGTTVRRDGPTTGCAWQGGRDKVEDSRYYNPMFYHGHDSESFNDLSGPVPYNDAGDKSRTMSNGSNIRSITKTTRKSVQPTSDTGAMIFYDTSCFYTDLGGDLLSMPSTIAYDKFSSHALGDPQPFSPPVESKGPLSWPSPDVSTYGDCDGESQLSGFEELCTSPEDTGEKDLIELPVTGIGGVMPEDNFLIDVEAEHAKTASKVVAARKSELNPTPLPPPSYAFLQFSSSSSDTEDSESEEEDMDEFASVEILRSGENDDVYIPPAFLNVYSSGSTRRTISSEDSSIDMLNYARKVNPDDIALREKEFQDEVGTSLVEQAPPASIAATIGDRSNFLTSQEDGNSIDERALKKRQSGSARPSMKRTASQLTNIGSPSKRVELE